MDTFHAKASSRSVAIIHNQFNESQNVCSLRARFLAGALRQSEAYEVDVFAEAAHAVRSRWSYFSWQARTFARVAWRGYHFVYVTSPPGPSMIFTLLSVFSSATVILDVRDPLSFNILMGYVGTRARRGLRWAAARCLESTAYILCDHFVVCTVGMLEYYNEVLPSCTKLVLAENGSQRSAQMVSSSCECQSTKALRYSSNSSLQVVCAGRLWEYSPEGAKLLLKFLSEYGSYTDKGVVLSLYGPYESNLVEYIERECRGIEVLYGGHISYEELVPKLAGADVGITVVRDPCMEYGTKIFDYLANGLVALAVAGQNTAFNKRFGSLNNVIVIDPDQIDRCDFEHLFSLLTERLRSSSYSSVREFMREERMMPLVSLFY